MEYVHDQRARDGEKGAFQIAGLDKAEMLLMEEDDEKAQKRADDKKIEENKVEKEKRRKTIETVIKGPALDEILEEQLGPDTVEHVGPDIYEIDPDFPVKEAIVSQNRMPLANLAKEIIKECDRWGVSSRAGAAVASAVLIDAGVVTKEDQTKIVDRNKLKRSIASYRESLSVSASIDWEISDDIEGIYSVPQKKSVIIVIFKFSVLFTQSKCYVK